MAQREIAHTSGSVSVGTSSTVVLAANASRDDVTIWNDGANVVYLALSTAIGVAPTATASNGVRLAVGGSWKTDGYTGAIAGIALTSATVVTIIEL